MTISITPATLPAATINSAYSQTMAGSGGTGPYTFAVTAGTLPAGLALDGSTGIISGTPTAAGPNSFTITATDSTSATGPQAFTLYVTGLIYWFVCANSAYVAALPIVAGNQLDFNRMTTNALAGVQNSRHDVGDLLARPLPTPVNDHLLCDGSAVGRLDFPQLFDVLGTSWGEGDGSTTFNLPNLALSLLPIATAVPTQTITNSTVSTDNTITSPTGTQTGGAIGGNYSSGGRTRTEIP